MYKGLKIGLGILTWERPKNLKMMLKDLENTDIGFFDKIIIMDDASKSSGKKSLLESSIHIMNEVEVAKFNEEIAKAGYPNMEIHSNKENKGVAGNTNRLLVIAKKEGFDIFYIANDDLLFKKPGWAKQYADVVINTPYKHAQFNKGAKNNVSSDVNGTQLDRKASLYGGALMVVDKNIVNNIGGFDEELGKFGFEHIDFSGRAYSAGLTVGFADIQKSKDFIDYSAVEGGENSTGRKADSAEKPSNLDSKSADYRSKRNHFRMSINPSVGKREYNFDVSVIVPTFNRPESLLLTLKTILGQKFDGKFEVLVANDGGQTVIKELEQKFGSDIKSGKLRYIDMPVNSGRSEIRNRGTYLAQGKYIYYIDDDDFMKQGALQGLYDGLKKSKSKLGMSYGKYSINSFRSNTRHVGSAKPVIHPLYSWGTIVTGNAMYSRELIEKAGFFDKSLPFSEDSDLFARCLHESDNVVKVNKDIMEYNVFIPLKQRKSYGRIDGIDTPTLSTGAVFNKYRNDSKVLDKVVKNPSGSKNVRYKDLLKIGFLPPLKNSLEKGEVVKLSLSNIAGGYNIHDGFQEAKIIGITAEKRRTMYDVELTDGTTSTVPFEQIVGSYRGYDGDGKKQTKWTYKQDKFKFLEKGGHEKWKNNHKEEKMSEDFKHPNYKISMMRFNKNVSKEYGPVLSRKEILNILQRKNDGEFSEKRTYIPHDNDKRAEAVIEKKMPGSYMRNYRKTRFNNFDAERMLPKKVDVNLAGSKRNLSSSNKDQNTYVPGPVVQDVNANKIIVTEEDFKLIKLSWIKSKLPRMMSGQKFVHINGRWGGFGLEALRRGAMMSGISQHKTKIYTPRMDALGDAFYQVEKKSMEIDDRSLREIISSRRTPLGSKKPSVLYITLSGINGQGYKFSRSVFDKKLWNWLDMALLPGGMLYVEVPRTMPKKYIGEIEKHYQGKMNLADIGTFIDIINPSVRSSVYLFKKEK